MDLNELRQEYAHASIDVDSVAPCPFKQFESWFGESRKAQINEPNAMVLSTVDANSHPVQRTVLLKYVDPAGFVFFTNYNSRKAHHIASNPQVSLLFPWYELQRQVEINGVVSKISLTDSLKYFALRPRGSQLGAWVSDQSTVVSSRSLLQNKLDEMKRKFGAGEIPKPDSWGGFRVQPIRFEFWQGGRNRLHDRIEYLTVDDTAAGSAPDWQRRRLAP